MGSRFAGIGSNFGGGPVFAVQTHTYPYQPPWASLGAHGGLLQVFLSFEFLPGPVPWKVSVLACGEQAVPTEQKRHGHMPGSQGLSANLGTYIWAHTGVLSKMCFPKLL